MKPMRQVIVISVCPFLFRRMRTRLVGADEERLEADGEHDAERPRRAASRRPTRLRHQGDDVERLEDEEDGQPPLERPAGLPFAVDRVEGPLGLLPGLGVEAAVDADDGLDVDLLAALHALRVLTSSCGIA